MDLAKAELIEATLALPFEFVIPDVMLAAELLDLGRYTRDDLLELGFKRGGLEGAEAVNAMAYYRQHRAKLSLNDCFAWRLAEVHQGILMTGDGDLRKLAGRKGVEVHGAHRAIELMATHDICPKRRLVACLAQLDADPLVRLPRTALRSLKEKLDTMKKIPLG
jgi:predicted nucleic acid-binding protein